jgi:hypothetical protein
MTRTFLVSPDRTVTLPQGLAAGPGATNIRLPAGSVVELEESATVAFSRFVNKALRNGDWTEIDAATAPKVQTAPIYVVSPNVVSTAPVSMQAGAPIVATKKEG